MDFVIFGIIRNIRIIIAKKRNVVQNFRPLFLIVHSIQTFKVVHHKNTYIPTHQVKIRLKCYLKKNFVINPIAIKYIHTSPSVYYNNSTKVKTQENIYNLQSTCPSAHPDLSSVLLITVLYYH